MMSRWKAEDDAIYIQFVWVASREKKRRSGEPCPYVTGKGLGRGTSFFDTSAGGVT
jgi:hypothetical protein